MKAKEHTFETCIICKLSIDLPTEHYLLLSEHRIGKAIASSYYHATCFREKFLVQHDMKKMINNMMKTMEKIG